MLTYLIFFKEIWHWHADPFASGVGIFWENKVNIMAADALAPYIVLAMQEKWVPVFHDDRFQQPVPSECPAFIENLLNCFEETWKFIYILKM